MKTFKDLKFYTGVCGFTDKGATAHLRLGNYWDITVFVGSCDTIFSCFHMSKDTPYECSITPLEDEYGQDNWRRCNLPESMFEELIPKELGFKYLSNGYESYAYKHYCTKEDISRIIYSLQHLPNQQLPISY